MADNPMRDRMTPEEYQRLSELSKDSDDLQEFSEKRIWKRFGKELAETVGSEINYHETSDPSASLEQLIKDQQTLWMVRGMNKAVRGLETTKTRILEEGQKAKRKLSPQNIGRKR